jgi:hypothetical protein
MASAGENERQLAVIKEQERQLSNFLVDAGIGFIKR